ncbi:MAG: peptidylprolyl isomerase [Alphaproteobacteria bacterium]|nr:peptidylprolyl isomerase [Alphaproteobacteria bacterium]
MLFASFLPSSAQAQRVGQSPNAAAPTAPAPTLSGGSSLNEQIAVIVNDNVISTADVRGRMALAMFSSNQPNTAEVKQRILPQIMRNLIDEQLQIQEGKRLDITVTAEEVDKALDNLAKQNNIPGGDIRAFLKSNGVPPETLADQAKASLTWSKVAMRTIRPKIDVGDDEVTDAIDRLKANAGKPERLVSEIFLSVDNPKEEEQVKSFAEHIVQQIKDGGNFGAIARQFSQGTGAANGGDIGWIQDGQLSQELNKVLSSAQKNEVLGPIRSSSGFHILGIRDQRTVGTTTDSKDLSISLQQAFLLFPPGQSKDVMIKEVESFRSNVSGCSDLASKIRNNFPKWRWQDLGEVELSKAPSWLAERTSKLPTGKPSEAMSTDKGALVLFVCGRKTEANIDRNAVISSIGSERMELLARRTLRDLRRAAYLDVRLNFIP